MPMAEIEIVRTRTVTISESATVEVNVPKSILDDPDELHSWIENKINNNQEFADLVNKKMATDDEDTEIDIDDVNHIV